MWGEDHVCNLMSLLEFVFQCPASPQLLMWDWSTQSTNSSQGQESAQKLALQCLQMFVEKRSGTCTGICWPYRLLLEFRLSVSVEELGIERAIWTQTYKREGAHSQQHGFVWGPVLDLKPQATALRKLLEVKYPAPRHSRGCHQPLG